MFPLSPLRFRVSRFSFVLLIFISVASRCSFAQSPPAHQHPAPLPAEDQEQFISYWTTETGWRTELDLRNNQVDQPLTVTPVLRATDGAEIPLSAVVVLPQEVKTLDVATAIGNSSPQLIGAYGSLVLRYRAPSGVNLYAVAMIMGVGHSIAFHVDGTGEDQTQDLGSREGIWWLPNTSAGDYLILANRGQNPLKTSLSVSDASGKSSAQTITLPPRGVARYSIRQIVAAAKLDGSYGGIKISAVNHAGSLDTLHVLFNETGSFSAVMKMFDYDPRAQLKERDYARTGKWTLRAPMLALANPDPSLAFPVGTVLLPQLFIRNVTSKPVEAMLAFNWRTDSSTGKASGPALHLSPFETRRIDVAALQDGKTLPQNAQWSSVILTTNALPGEVMAVGASYDQSLRYGAQTPFSDQMASHWAASQWQYDPQHGSVITVGNGGTKATRAAFTIFYNQGTQKYELEQTLQPDEQMWIDVGKLIRESIHDKNGKPLPADLTSGSYEIWDLTHKGIGTLFEGKVIYDKTYGHVTYGCGICCGYKRIVMFFNPLGIPLLSTSGNGVDGQDACSLEYTDISGDFDGNWSTASTSVATVDTYGTHTGQGVGSTTSTTFAEEVWYVSKYSCPIMQRNSRGNDNVTPSILLGGSNGTNITNKTQPVVVGQQIVLYGKYRLPSGYTFSSQSWTVPGTGSTPPTAISNFTYASDFSSGGPVVLTSTQLSQQTVSFYFVAAANSQQVTFTLNYVDNQSQNETATATTTFNIAGPTGVSVTVPPLGQWQINPNSKGFELDFGFPISPDQGIQFNGKATSPPGYTGTYEWAQLITADSSTYAAPGTSTLTCTAGTGIDNTFPYGNETGLSVADSPSLGLPSADNKVTRSDNFIMYLMWRPGLTSDIPVPLGYVIWQIFGDAVQTGGTWAVQADSSKSANGFQLTTSYPLWTGKVTGAVGTITCH